VALQRFKRAVKPAAQETVDRIVGSLYVHDDDFRAALEDVRRVLDDRITAGAEIATLLGHRVNELEAIVAELREEVRALRSTAS
jgi:hypothetical protein